MYKIRGNDGREYGPVPTDQLHQWIREGRANAQTMVQLEGSTEWQALGTFPEFAASLNAPVTPSSPVTGVGMATLPRNHPLAVTGLIMGIIAITIGLCCCHGLPFNLLGIIFSAIALAQIKAKPHEYTGRGLAIAGLILSIVSIVLGLLFLIIGVAFNLPELMREFRNMQ